MSSTLKVDDLPNAHSSVILPPQTTKSASGHKTSAVAFTNLFQHDQKKIEEALGGIKNAALFSTTYNESFRSIKEAASKEIAALRAELMNKALNSSKHPIQNIQMRGLKLSKIKKWKIIVQFQDDGKISQLFIGKKTYHGAFVHACLTLTGRAILIPTKRLESAQNLIVIAFENIAKFHENYDQDQKLSDETLALCDKLYYTPPKLLQLLPDRPEKFMIGTRPVLVTSQATPVETIFRHKPKNIKEIITRLNFLKDASVCLLLFHRMGGIHGDVKTGNILVKGNIAQLHDYGGSRIFSEDDTYETAKKKFCQLGFTALYTQYHDYRLCLKLGGKCKVLDDVGHVPTNVNEILRLGRAHDVYALGLSLIEAVQGMQDSFGNPLYPFQPDSYVSSRKGDFPRKICSRARNISCSFRKMPDIDSSFQNLIQEVLKMNYLERISVETFISELSRIIIHLKIEDQPESLPDG